METIHIRLPKELHKALKICAITKEVSMNALVGDCIERYLSEVRKEVA
jgi:predicted HicB family RNase H-like nuclease